MFQNKNKAPKGLNIIIVGYGKVGSALIEQLSQEGHDITLIDTNSDKVQAATNLYDIMGITGNGASYSVQMEAGVEAADLLIAVTPSDELNLLCCTIARGQSFCTRTGRDDQLQGSQGQHLKRSDRNEPAQAYHLQYLNLCS